MAQTANKGQPRKSPAQPEKPIIPERFQHTASIFIIFVSLVVFFRVAIFEGKVFVSADSVASESFLTLVKDADNEGTVPLWNPYIFCGMPGVASMTASGTRNFDITALILGKSAYIFASALVNTEVGHLLFFYMILGCGVYLFAYSKLRSKLIALIVALATMYSTFIIIWVMASHLTKIAVIAFFPYVFYMAEQLREKFRPLIAVMLAVVIHFLFLPGHIQMIFYTFFALGIYYLFFLVRALVKKEKMTGLIRSGVVVAVAGGVAFLMTADQYLSTLEYTKFSIRGSEPIQMQQQVETGNQKKTSAGGLDYDYATSWSFGPGEMLTFFVPSLYGFGNFNYSGSLTNNETTRLYTYFGPQPFTDAPQYMGIVILVLAIIGIVKNRKEPFVQFLVILSFIALLISFGKEFPIVYDLMYKYFPLFNKFRGPSSILVLVQLAVPMLAGYGALALLSLRDRQFTLAEAKKWKRVVVSLGIAAVLSLIARPIVESIYATFFPESEAMAVIGRSYQPAAQNAIFGIMTAEVSQDVFLALILLVITFGAFWLYAQRTIRLPVLGVVLLATVTIDLWRVDAKPMEYHNAREAHIESFGSPDYVKFLLRDTTLYRTLEFDNGQPPYSNTLAYWRIQSAYGYQGAKMRAYQDIVENVGLWNPLLWGLMDVRYIISNTRDSSAILQPVFQGRDRIIYRNRGEMPRAFFVNRCEVASDRDILKNIRNLSFNPQDVAYVPEDPHVAIDPPGVGVQAHYTKYDLQNLELSVTATGNNLLFLSEAYYPKGWKAFIDGNQVTILRLDYLFRGVIVPPGTHSLVMKFEPSSYYIGRTASLSTNLILLTGIVVLGIDRYRKKSRMRRHFLNGEPYSGPQKKPENQQI